MPADQDNAEELLVTIAQQVAQASRTTALHIEQHDDIEKAAQEKADIVITKVRETLETAHQSALDQATEALKSSHNQELHTNLTTIAKKFNETLDDLVRRHRSTLQEHIETLKKADEERAESHSQEMDRIRNEVQRAEDQTQAQRREMEDSHREALAQTANTLERERAARNERYQQLCSDTTTRMEENPGRRLGGKLQDQRGQVYRDKGNQSKAESRRRCRPRGEGYEMAQDHPHSRRSNPDRHRHGHRGGHDGADMRMDDLLNCIGHCRCGLSRSDCQRPANAHPILALV